MGSYYICAGESVGGFRNLIWRFFEHYFPHLMHFTTMFTMPFILVPQMLKFPNPQAGHFIGISMVTIVDESAEAPCGMDTWVLFEVDALVAPS